jgi:hypothetical protein
MPISLPITNSTKRGLWVDIEPLYKEDTPRLYIEEHEEDYMPDKEVFIESGETIVLEFELQYANYRIKDKEGYII